MIAALTPAGALASTSAFSGTIEPPDASTLYGVEFDSQDRILVTGAGPHGVLLSRYYLTTGTPDPTFATDGTASARFDRAAAEGHALAFTPDGRILVATQRTTGFRSDHDVLGLMQFLVADGPSDPDADGVIGKRDRCPDLGGKASDHGCPLIERTLRVMARGQGIKGAVHTDSRYCRSKTRAAIFVAKPGRDDLVGREAINKHGRFHARLGQAFQGRVYSRVGAFVSPVAGLCASAQSNTVSVGTG